MAICVQEAFKTIPDALGEVREAADFCRYYAMQARRGLVPIELPGPTGERNTLRFEGRGVWATIAPWNFPLAIFLGQTVAALVTGNTVVAKPAPQTPAIAGSPSPDRPRRNARSSDRCWKTMRVRSCR